MKQSCVPFRGMFVAACLAIAAAHHANAQSYDLLLKGGEVLDGTGSPAIRADVAIRGNRIAAVGVLENVTARRTVDVSGRTIVPGFIDLHSHADGPTDSGLRSRDERRRAAPNLVAQGITTVVVNQDGRSPASIRRQRQQLKRRGFGPNAILMVGHNSIRQKVLGPQYKRPASETEIAAMIEELRDGMEDGAWGLSAGLEYVPGIWSETQEVRALVRSLKPYQGVYIVHERASGEDPMWYLPSRDEPGQPSMIDNIHEQIGIAETTGVTTVATHIKARGVNFWGSSKAMIEAIENARARGVPIFADQYPYNTSGSDGAIVLIPRWVAEEFEPIEKNRQKDYAEMLERALADGGAKLRIVRDTTHMISRRGGPGNIVVFDHPDKNWIGKSLADLALAREISPVDMAFEIQFTGYSERLGGARLRGFSMSEEDIEAFAAQPWCLTASDAGIALPDDPPVHARYYGTFPRKIHHYAKTRGVLSVEAAIRSMTTLPAEVLRLRNRGKIAEGYIADIAVIDLTRIRDRADFFEPHQYPDGVDYVLVNGTFVVEGGRLTYATPGEVLTIKDDGMPQSS